MENIDYSRRCDGCGNPNGFCATYVGPLFDHSPRQVLFIGLDSGKDGNGSPDGDEWRTRVLAHYRDDQNDWNTHYKVSIFMAADILGLNHCKKECQKACSRHPLASCALANLAQGNAVKCLAPGKETMEFKPAQKKLIPSCLPLIFQEAASMQPDIIVLQGSGMEDQFYDLLRTHGKISYESLDPDESKYSGIMTWSSTGKTSIVITSWAPVAFRYQDSFKKFMEEHIAPRLNTINKCFRDRSPNRSE